MDSQKSTATGPHEAATREHDQANTPQSPDSPSVILDNNIDAIPSDEESLSRPNLSMPEKSTSVETASASHHPKPRWSHIDYSAQAIILKEMTDCLGSLMMACTTLRLRQQEIDEFLKRHGEEPSQEVYLIHRALVQHGCKYLEYLELGKYAKNVGEWSGWHSGDWPLVIKPIHIPPNDLELFNFDLNLPSFSQLEAENRQKTRDLIIQGLVPPGTESVALSFNIAKPSFVGSPQGATIRIHYIRLPAGATVIGPSGKKELFESGRYSVVYPSTYPNVPAAYEMLICENAPKYPMGSERDTIGLSSEPTNVEQRQLDNTEWQEQPGYQDKEQAKRHIPAAFEQNLPLLDSDHVPVIPDTFSHGSHLPLQSESDAIRLDPNSYNPQANHLADHGYKAMMQFCLPKGYFIVSPKGYSMSFDAHHMTLGDGLSPSGLGGEYTVIPPGGNADVPLYHSLSLDDAELMRMTFKEPMALFRDGKMLPRLLEQGIHRFARKNGELEVSGELGKYDLDRPYRRPESPGDAFGVEQRAAPIRTPTISPLTMRSNYMAMDTERSPASQWQGSQSGASDSEDDFMTVHDDSNDDSEEEYGTDDENYYGNNDEYDQSEYVDENESEYMDEDESDTESDDSEDDYGHAENTSNTTIAKNKRKSNYITGLSTPQNVESKRRKIDSQASGSISNGREINLVPTSPSSRRLPPPSGLQFPIQRFQPDVGEGQVRGEAQAVQPQLEAQFKQPVLTAPKNRESAGDAASLEKSLAKPSSSVTTRHELFSTFQTPAQAQHRRVRTIDSSDDVPFNGFWTKSGASTHPGN
ncbi:hypothetical protein F4804DRAFT_353750 [Jackrogersella minutella]|nr:hypothetical protein F4804DRAFT_353750 [Jackrogersella minutella]